MTSRGWIPGASEPAPAMLILPGKIIATLILTGSQRLVLVTSRNTVGQRANGAKPHETNSGTN